jgi:hypothetical protein
MKPSDYNKRKRLITLIIILLMIPLGILAKEYHGQWSNLVANKLTGTLYVIFWCQVTFFIFPNTKIVVITISIFLITCSLEFVQLYSSPPLEVIRSNYIGRAIIGSSFSWTDFIFYAIGSIIAYFLMRVLNTIQRSQLGKMS